MPLTVDEPGYISNSFAEILFIFNKFSQPIQLDIFHGFTFQILGIIFGCIFDLNFCRELNVGGDKNFFWQNFENFIILTRIPLMFLNILGSTSIALITYLITKKRNSIPITLVLVNLFPIWNSMKIFHNSDYPAMVGFSIILLYFLYFEIKFKKNSTPQMPSLILRYIQSPWFLNLGIFIIFATRLPLIFFAFVLILNILVFNKRLIRKIINKSFYRSLVFYLFVYVITNLRSTIDIATNPLNLITTSINFKTSTESTAFVLGNIYPLSNLPIWYVSFNLLSKIPIFYLLSFLLLNVFYFQIIKKYRTLLLFLVYVVILPIIIQMLLKSTTYDSARHFYFTQVFLIVLTSLFITEFFSEIKYHQVNVLKKIFFFFLSLSFTILIFDTVKLSRYNNLYRNEFTIVLGIESYETDYWGLGRKQLTLNESKIVVGLKEDWFPPSDKMYDSSFILFSNLNSAESYAEKKSIDFLYRPINMLEFAKFESEYPNCQIINQVYARQMFFSTSLGKVYRCYS